MFSGINQIDFSRSFHSDKECYDYLIESKWGKGFKCIRCGHDGYYKGRAYYYRRCKKCCYDESATANTVFHDMKMPILKAFQMMFRVACKKKGMSTVELGTEVGVQQKTAWFFKRKMQTAIAAGSPLLLKNSVEMDETLIGGYSEGKPGRSLGEKDAVMVAIERLTDGHVGNIALNCIEGFTEDIFEHAVDTMVAADAKITTDTYPSWEALKDKMPNLVTKKSEKGKAFKELHQQIMIVKIWLRGIHHKCSAKHLQGYLDEYAFRFNNRNQRHRIFDILVGKMMHLNPQPFIRKQRLCECNT